MSATGEVIGRRPGVATPSAVWDGCAATFDADATFDATAYERLETSGTLHVTLSQQCAGGPVCTATYDGRIAR